LKAQHVSSGTPLIISSSKLNLQPSVYIPLWQPSVAKAEWEMHFPLPFTVKKYFAVLCSEVKLLALSQVLIPFRMEDLLLQQHE
jgi:hypothetical protein